MEENNLLSQLGVDWKLLLSQAVNFLIVLVVLRMAVFKPLLNIIRQRNKKIQEGIRKADEAEVRLREVDHIAAGKLREADAESLNIIKATEQRAKLVEQSLLDQAQDRQKKMIDQIELLKQRQQEEVRQQVLQQAGELMKKIVVKTVELNPDAIDEALVQKAISTIHRHEA